MVSITIDDIAWTGALNKVRIDPERANIKLTLVDVEVHSRGYGVVQVVAEEVVWLQYVSVRPPIINSQNGCHGIGEVENSPILAMVETDGPFTILKHPLSGVAIGHDGPDPSKRLTSGLVHVRLYSYINIEFACPRNRLQLHFTPEDT